MATASDWLSAAYNRSSNNDAGKLASDAELLAHANRLYQRLWAMYGRARPDAASETASLMLAGSPPSATLPTDMVDLVQLWNADGDTVHVIPSRDRNRSWNLAPSVYRYGNTIVSRAQSGDPLAAAVLSAQVIPSPTALTTLATVIDARFPVRAHQIVIDLLAVYLSVKDDGRDQNEHAKLLSDVRVTATAFASEFNLPPDAVSWIHSEAERQPMPA